jgi:hypothetical protein
MLEFDLYAANHILKRGQIPFYDFKIAKSPILISIYLLKSLTALSSLFKNMLLESYCNYVADIWLPNPQQKDREKKENVKSILPKILSLLYKERKQIFKPAVHSFQLANYTNLKHKFLDLEKSFQDTMEKDQSTYTIKSNPFITVSIGRSLDEGQRFQISAKIASSIETKWGNWVESIIPLFNKNVVKVGAGGFDVILNDTAYDIKSGPNVMNKGQVYDALAKRDKIRQMSLSPEFSKIVKVTDFKVATAYGKRSSAEIYMKSENSGLILFGADSWKTLTGDEWNAFRLFMWQLQHLIQTKKWKPDRDNIIKSMEIFFECSYDQYQEKFNESLQRPEYLELINFN